MKAGKLDSFYVSTNDIFLNEYVPLTDSHRYYFTNFTGSTAEVIVPLEGKVVLFVDGRYYEQADMEVDPKLVEVFKVPYGMGMREAMNKIMTERKLKALGAIFETISWVKDQVKAGAKFSELDFYHKCNEFYQKN
eukprot:gene13990-13781_t